MAHIYLDDIKYQNESRDRGYLGDRLIWEVLRITSTTYSVKEYQPIVLPAANAEDTSSVCNYTIIPTYHYSNGTDIVGDEVERSKQVSFEKNTSKELVTRKGTFSDEAYGNTEINWELKQLGDIGVVINDAQYVTITYTWTEGEDIDHKCGLIESQKTAVGGDFQSYAGFGGSSSFGHGTIQFGGDNTGTGAECDLIKVSELNQQSEILTYKNTGKYFLCFQLEAHFWAISKAVRGATLTLVIDAYQGGTMSKSGYIFINSGGTKIASKTFTGTVNKVGSEGYDTYGYLYINMQNGSLAIIPPESYFDPY